MDKPKCNPSLHKKGQKENNATFSNHNTTNLNKQKQNTKEDPTGCNFSIARIMKLQSDFTNEITLLQNHRTKMGVTIDRSLKFHPEIAGKGIKYNWGSPGSTTKGNHSNKKGIRRNSAVL